MGCVYRGTGQTYCSGCREWLPRSAYLEETSWSQEANKTDFLCSFTVNRCRTNLISWDSGESGIFPKVRRKGKYWKWIKWFRRLFSIKKDLKKKITPFGKYFLTLFPFSNSRCRPCSQALKSEVRSFGSMVRKHAETCISWSQVRARPLTLQLALSAKL
jgi:hypothetical protein